MPRRPKKPCNYQGCPELIGAGERYCSHHKTTVNREVKKRRTDKEQNRFYKTARWQKLRKLKLNRDPLCEPCLEKGRTTPATIVHHDEEIREGGAWLPDLDELTSICLSCHSKHHARLK